MHFTNERMNAIAVRSFCSRAHVYCIHSRFATRLFELTGCARCCITLALVARNFDEMGESPAAPFACIDGRRCCSMRAMRITNGHCHRLTAYSSQLITYSAGTHRSKISHLKIAAAAIEFLSISHTLANDDDGGGRNISILFLH